MQNIRDDDDDDDDDDLLVMAKTPKISPRRRVHKAYVAFGGVWPHAEYQF